MGLVFVPLYIKFLGIESYGLIGFFATLQMVFSVLDLGLSTTINRELARAADHPEQAEETRDLVRTLEVIYWAIAGLIGMTIIVLSPWISHYWLKGETLSVSTVENSVLLLGFVTACQWPIGFYSGGLMGLQRQFVNNIIISSLATIRGAGAVIVVWLVSPTIEAYFLWQFIVSVIGVTWFAMTLWNNLTSGRRSARFNVLLIQSVWNFAVGITGISIVTMLLTQADKILLSTLLPLDVFGYYTLAGVVAAASVFAVGPIFTAVFPRFSQLVALGEKEQLKKIYHQSCQLVSVAIIPPALLVAFFSFELLAIWTGDLVLAEQTHWLVSLLVVGTILNSFMLIPYALQLAHGWTRLTFYANIIAVIFLLPLIFVLATTYGAIGAATVWIMLNTGYVLFCIPYMHRRLLTGEAGCWYRIDVGRPLVVALVIVAFARFLYPNDMTIIETVIGLSAIGLSMLLGALWTTPFMRHWVIQHLRCWIYAMVPDRTGS